MSWTHNQDFVVSTIRPASILTTGYVIATVIQGIQGAPTPNGVPGGYVGAQDYNQLVLDFFFTKVL